MAPESPEQPVPARAGDEEVVRDLQGVSYGGYDERTAAQAYRLNAD